MEKVGNQIVSRVENFRKENGRLPDSRSEMSLPEEETIQPFYEKRGENDYVIYYNIGFDKIKAYYSDSKKWENVDR
jgi:hypothetical protein